MKKIRILFLITGLTHGGAELTLSRIVSKLEMKKFEISICSITNTTDILPRLRKNINRIYFLGAKNAFSSIKALYKLRKIIKLENPDILHCFMFHANILGRLAAIGIKCEVISSIRTKLIYNNFWNFIDNLTQNLVDVYMVNSNTLFDFISDYGINERKIVMIENGVDFTNLKVNFTPNEIKKQLKLPNLPVITMVANFKKQKDYPTLIRALAHLQNKLDFSFLAVGSGLKFEDESEKVKNLIKSLKLKNARLLGFRDDVVNILSITDVWVSSTLFEGQSNSLLEAMAMKVPIVTTNIPENKEVVRNKKEALLVSVKSYKELSTNIEEILMNKALSRKLTEEAYKRVTKNYSIGKMMAKLETLYKSIVLSRLAKDIRKNWIRKKLYHAGYLIFLRTNYFTLIKEYRMIKALEYKSKELITSIQRRRLYDLVMFAVNNVPYYYKFAQEKKIRITESTIFEDLKKFPILTKEIIRANWEKLHTNLINLKRYMMTTSGGTTGEPIKILHDFKFRVKNESSTIFFNEIGRYHVGDKLVMLWGSEKDILRESEGIFNKIIIKYVKNTHFQNAFRLSDSILDKYIKQINQIKPSTILAYVQSIYEMAKYIKRKNLRIHSPDSIITSAGDLSKELRVFLEDIFQCRVYNRYGTREVGNIATSCEKSDKLHINMFLQYVEILDNDCNELSEHEKGNIIITNLTNYGMPLIRYKIGDIGSLDYSQCPCGRGFIRFDNVYGRIIDIFKNEKGDLIYGDYFTHLFYFRENIKIFQIVQEKINRIDVNIVTLNGKPFTSTTENEFKGKIRVVMGKNCKVYFNYVSDINPSRSGKFIYTISKI